MSRRVSEGAPEPLGVTLDATGANVAVYSAHAEAIDLCLFDAAGEVETERLRLSARTGDVFHARIEGLGEGRRYGLRAHGPYDPQRGHRFNASKLLVDPYALAIDRPFALHFSMFGFARDDLSLDRTDSAPFVPKGVVTRPQSADLTSRPRTPFDETIIYELHVRGFTKLLGGVPAPLRGTFAGLAHAAAVDHLVRLGATTVEIMPSAAWVDERHLSAAGLANYWGYNPIAMMAPDPRLAPGGWWDVRAAVAALHAAGLEVIVDVVFNHTGEGDALGPTLSLRGLDNAAYYRLQPNDPRHYANDSGCGNVLALDRPHVVRYVMDSLRAWAAYAGVDGFRFDLATTLARRDNGFDAAAPLLAAISQDPVLRDLKLIAEPWDLGPGGYRLGNFPSAWGEWNDRFRVAARRFWRGDDIGVGELATRLSGSSDVFGRRRRPSRSVNFVTAHDGFTLADLVSYEDKHNEANGEGNRDGASDNQSWNNGVEGDSADPQVIAARRRDQRNLLATLLLARGTPMLSMGAEMGHSQDGNNNAYAQDNALAWIDWDEADASLIEFTARLVAFRKENPATSRDRFCDGEAVDATLLPDVEWRKETGAAMEAGDWSDPHRRTLIASLYAPADGGREANRIALAFHAGRESIDIALPPPRDGFDWRVAFDTSLEENDAALVDNGVLHLTGRSVVALREEHAHGRRGGAITTELLGRLAGVAGVETRWFDIDGAEHEVPRETLSHLLRQMGLPAESLSQGRELLSRLADVKDRRTAPQSLLSRDDEPIVLRLALADGRMATGLTIAREDGSEQRVRLRADNVVASSWRGVDGRKAEGVLATLPAQPLGRHRVFVDGAEEDVCRLTIAPRRCYTPPEFSEGRRAFGLAAQLYSLRRPGDQGVGDFTTLAELSQTAAHEGAALVAINPLHALFPRARERASPYYPSDRRFLDSLYLDLARLDELVGAETLRAALGGEETSIEALAAAPEVDYRSVHAVKQRVLERVFTAFDDFTRRRPDDSLACEFSSFISAGGLSLHRFACFEAIGERDAEPWPRWPAGLREARPDALRAFAEANAAPLRFHSFLQWLCDRQSSGAARDAASAGLRLGLCRDLAIGSAPDGAESWSGADELLSGFSIGAPPDPFSRDGQVWGLPAPDPLARAANGHAAFAELLSANMRHAGALRIDHVMGLSRLFVVPEGARAVEGAYLSFPADELVGQLALESVRARCLVVGEDLGTVPAGFRDRLAAADVLSYRVLWFERDADGFLPPRRYARQAMACVSTHDLPTLKGWWLGEDIAEKSALGLLAPEAAQAAMEVRQREKRELLDALRAEGLLPEGADEEAPFDDAIAGAVHAFVARSPSVLTMAQIDDLAGESTAINLPGTDLERSNWRRKLDGTLAEIFASGTARSILGAFCRNLDQITPPNRDKRRSSSTEPL